MARKNNFFKLDMLLLCIIAKQDCYGYEITKQIKTYSHELIDIKEGTMYPILYKLQDENYISNYEKVIDRKVRVYYHIEEKGKEKLLEMINEFTAFGSGSHETTKLCISQLKKYIKNIWTIMPMHTKKEKFYVSELKKHLNEYLDDHPQCSYDDIVQQFGEPKDIVVEYIQSSDENDLIKRMKLKTILQKFLIFFSVICTILAIWFGVLWYSYMQDAKNSIIYEIETTISDN
jgi:DNA-binding PadR family transcriptional regulator